MEVDLYGLVQIADACGKSARWLLRHRHDHGGCPMVREIGGRWAARRVDVLAWLRGERVGVDADAELVARVTAIVDARWAALLADWQARHSRPRRHVEPGAQLALVA